MNATAMKNPPVKEVTVARVFDAPPALVYRMWTEAKHVAAWWGPRHFTNPKCTVDARVGGEMNITMRGPDGADYPMTAEFTEVVANRKLVFTAFARDLDGNKIEAVFFAMEEPKPAAKKAKAKPARKAAARKSPTKKSAKGKSKKRARKGARRR